MKYYANWGRNPRVESVKSYIRCMGSSRMFDDYNEAVNHVDHELEAQIDQAFRDADNSSDADYDFYKQRYFKLCKKQSDFLAKYKK